MQKFVPQNRIEIFGNERTRSTPLDPKLMFWCIFVVFGVHLSMFRYNMKLGAKWVELVQLMQNFEPRSRIGMFCNERTQSNPLDPKLVFRCISYCFVTVVNSVQNGLNWCN